jgi:hypothetical protein
MNWQTMKPKLLFGLAFVLGVGLLGCATANQRHSWPVFYDGATQLSIPRQPQTMASYTNGIPDWNYELLIPAATITSARVQNLGAVDGWQVVEVRLVLTDLYYTDALLIFEEVASGLFLPVYVQDYNRQISSPSANVVSREGRKLIVNAGMDYSGTGHFHNGYKITISPHQDPTVIRMPNPSAEMTVRYHNSKYNFTLSLPASWRGYSVLIQQWEGHTYIPAKDAVATTEKGPVIVLRHPQWQATDPNQDIPIQVFTRSQWAAYQRGEFSIGAGGFEEEIAHNAKFVFTFSSRFNASDLKGWQEAGDIVTRNRKANAPHLQSE